MSISLWADIGADRIRTGVSTLTPDSSVLPPRSILDDLRLAKPSTVYPLSPAQPGHTPSQAGLRPRLGSSQPSQTAVSASQSVDYRGTGERRYGAPTHGSHQPQQRSREEERRQLEPHESHRRALAGQQPPSRQLGGLGAAAPSFGYVPLDNPGNHSLVLALDAKVASAIGAVRPHIAVLVNRLFAFACAVGPRLGHVKIVAKLLGGVKSLDACLRARLGGAEPSSPAGGEGQR